MLFLPRKLRKQPSVTFKLCGEADECNRLTAVSLALFLCRYRCQITDLNVQLPGSTLRRLPAEGDFPGGLRDRTSSVSLHSCDNFRNAPKLLCRRSTSQFGRLVALILKKLGHVGIGGGVLQTLVRGSDRV